MPLTAKAIEAAKPKDKPYKLTDGHGLYLHVMPTGLKAWRANYRVDGKQKTVTYGRWPRLSLSDARKAHVLRQDEPEAPPAKDTFQQVADDWVKLKLPTLSNAKHRKQVENTLVQHVYPVIGHMPIDTIKRTDIVAAIKSVAARGTLETAQRVAGRVAAVFHHALNLGLIDSHPAIGIRRVLPQPVVQHLRTVQPEDAGELLRAIHGYGEPVTRIGLLLLAHTFVRSGEMRGMRWSELNRDDAVWVIPGERMKMRVPHVVPLSRQVLALLDEVGVMTGDADLVLDSLIRPGKQLSENTFLFALYRLGYRGRMTVHGFRALASTVLNEQSPFDPEIIERQLSHRERDAVRAAYNRAEYLDERRKLMQWWSDWLDHQAGDSSQSAASA